MNPSSSFSSASSSASATVRVEKATSEFLIGPDWTMNIDICDTINSNHWLAKDVVKAVKKRLQHKNPKVQLLALTLLETMVKNCGDYVHFQIAERNILQEMVKIVKKKIDMHVREKILALLNSWQEAFGGPGGKHPQYYWAYEELRRSGVEFPHRTLDAAPIFTPPVTIRHAQADYGMPSNSSTRLDEAMASELENLSLSSIKSMQNILDLLSDMLQAVNPNDRAAVKDEVIVDLVDRCRANQKKLMHMLTTTGDEELLGQGLELNDSLQNVLAKHDAIASGSTLPNQVEFSPPPTPTPSAPFVAVARNQIEEEGEEEDDFTQLARRHAKMRSTTTQVTSIGTSEGISNSETSSTSAASAPSLSNALTLADQPAPVRTTKEQDMIDFLSITLSTTSPHTHPPTASTQTPVSATTQEYPYANNYVVPWAQPQPQQPQSQPRPQTQPHPQFSSGYPPPPWAATPGYYSNQNPLPTYSTPRANTSTSFMPLQGTRPSFTARGSNGSVAINGDARVISTPTGTAPLAGHKPFVPSYRLFEDLNVLGNPDGRFRTSSNTSPSLSGTSSQSMVGGRK